MMSQPTILQIRYSWRLPVLCSLLVHAGLVVPLLFLTPETTCPPGSGPIIDTVVLDLQNDVHVTLADQPSQNLGPKATISFPSNVPVAEERTALRPMPVSLDSPTLTSFGAQLEPKVSTGRVREELVGPAAATDPGTPQKATGHVKPTASFCNVYARAESIVYVIDRSASMGLDGSWDAAKRELLISLDCLPSTARFQIIAYNRTAEPLVIGGRAELVYATPENKRQAALRLEKLYAEGGTEHMRALRRALALQPDVIFLLTDGVDLRADQIRFLTLINHGRSVIHAIEAGGSRIPHGPHALHLLAEQNQGIYRSVLLAR